MVRFAIVLTLCLTTSCIVGQELGYEEKLLGSHWTLDGERARKRELRDQLKVRPAAFREYRKWEEAQGVGVLLRSTGSAMVLVGAADENWTIMGISLGAFLGGMALLSVEEKKRNTTIEVFNSSKPVSTSELSRVKLDVVISERSAGLVLRF